MDNLPQIELVETPNAASIAELAAFIGLPPAATAKAVFFDTPERGLVFAVVRGDLEVSEEKLRAVAGVTALAPASAAQIAASGAVAGYASPVGLAVLHAANAAEGIFVIVDQSVAAAGPLVAGANREGYHLRNVVYGRDWQATVVADIATVRAGDTCARCGESLRIEKGVEIGHIFKLGTRFSTALHAHYLGVDGMEHPVVMGSYGIGLERMLQILVEQHADERGIRWPAAVAPFDIQLVRLGKSDDVRAAADSLYSELRHAGLRVLYDDRDETAGVKFNDADLIGLPMRVLVSERLLKADQVELKPRAGIAVVIPRAAAVAAAQARLQP